MLEKGLNEVMEGALTGGPASQGDLAYAYAKSGKTNELRRLLNRLLEEVIDNKEFSCAIAAAYANLGQPDEAMEWLQKAYDEHSGLVVATNNDFAFDVIRGDPRFQTLMKRIGWTRTT